MGLFGGTKKKEEEQRIYFSAIDGLKKLYKSKIKPVEEAYMFESFYSNTLSDADFDANPQVLLLGQYSVGKTSFIRYLIEQDFPGSHVGPEPTTDRFMAIMHGATERTIPGNALAVQEDKPFRGLQQFGTNFLQRLECSQCPSPVLEKVTFIDSPGVLSGEKQRVARGYDFTRVIEWFARKSDLIILLFDAHKLDISDEFKRAISALKPHDEKIRVVLNKADSVGTQQLMRVYGALMWSLGKVTQTPEVKRVYISSFWDKEFKNESNKELFEHEREDLLKELRELPRNSAMRKINELVKRTRQVKVHALLIGHIKSLMPSMFGKASKKQWILDNMKDIFKQVQREHHLPFGDFPNIDAFRTCIQEYDFSKFAKLDIKAIEAMDQVLGRDIPQLMNQFPSEREDEALARAREQGVESGNPFLSSASEANAAIDWIITVSEKAKYRTHFLSCNPTDGKVAGDAAKNVLMKSKLDFPTLGRIWNLSDVDNDGFLDLDEFCVAMRLCHEAMKGKSPPDTLPEVYIPPSKRALLRQQASGPFSSPANTATTSTSTTASSPTASANEQQQQQQQQQQDAPVEDDPFASTI